MNEMNNKENSSNNQNIEQQNMNQNNMVESIQEQKEQPFSEPPKKNNALVIILLILVIGLSGFIAYDKFIKNEETKKPGTTNQQAEIMVVDAYNSNNGVLVIPKLTGNSTNIKTFNKKIADAIITNAKNVRNTLISEELLNEDFSTNYEIEDFESVYKFLSNLSSGSEVDLGLENVNYKSYKKNGVIAINFNTQIYCTETCGNYGSRFWYFYDVEFDEEINFKTAAKKFEATLNDESISNYDNLPSSCFDIEIDEYNKMNISDEGTC